MVFGNIYIETKKNKMAETVLITGGTGMIGQRLTQLLLAKGYQVAYLSREQQSIPNVKIYRWNIDNNSTSSVFRIFREDDATAANGLEMVKVDTSGNLQLSQANTSVLNSSGRKILNQTGGVLQVVNTIKTNQFTTTSGSPVDVTGLSASITPSSSILG